MKFYRLKQETDSDVIGDVGGVQCFINDYNNPTIDERIEGRSKKKIDFIRLEEKDVLTDTMACGSMFSEGFVVSKRFYDVVRKYRLKGIQFVEIEFERRKDINGYHFMYFDSNLFEEIDYSQTKFGIKKISMRPGMSKIEALEDSDNTFSNIMEITQKYAGQPRYKLEVINGYNFKSEMNWDVFSIGEYDHNFYFSERVCTELKQQNLTGFELIESSHFIG